MKTGLLGIVFTAVSIAQTLPTIHVNATTGVVETGKALTTLQDLDGDGVREIVATNKTDVWVTTPGCPSCTYVVETSGIRVFSGRTGGLLMSHDDPPVNVGSEQQTYPALAESNDVDGDGKNDILWALKLSLRVISSQTGATLRSQTFTVAGASQALALGLASLEDADGDGIRDYVVGEPQIAFNPFGSFVGNVKLFSGATGAQIWSASEPNPVMFFAQPSTFGSSVAGLGDVNGDGLSDVVVSAPNYTGGKIVALSGANGSVLWATVGTLQQWERGISNAGDVDGDGIADVVTPIWPSSGLRWRSGATGSVLNTITGLNINPKPVAGGFDVDGDGVPDAAITGQAALPGGLSVTYTYVYSSTGAHVATFPTTQPSLHKSLMLTPDLNGDGIGDLVTADRFDAIVPSSEVRANTILGAQPYGNSSPAASPLLSWVGLGPQSSRGVVAVTGATPSGQCLLAASLAPFSPTASPQIWIDPQQLILLQSIQFDATGTLLIPLDLRQPSIAGVSAYLQAADLSPPAVAATNGLQLLFGY